MSLLKTVWNGIVSAKDSAEGIAVSLIVIFGIVGMIIFIPWIVGTVAFWLGSIAFPEYINFTWGFWKPIALGLLAYIF